MTYSGAPSQRRLSRFTDSLVCRWFALKAAASLRRMGVRVARLESAEVSALRSVAVFAANATEGQPTTVVLEEHWERSPIGGWLRRQKVKGRYLDGRERTCDVDAAASPMPRRWVRSC